MVWGVGNRPTYQNSEIIFSIRVEWSSSTRLRRFKQESAHVQVLHSGVRETLAQLREKYRIPLGRQFVRGLVRKCVTCQKTDGPPYRPVSSPPLPLSRVSEGQAFSTTGVDYAGPLYVKNSTGDRSSTKVYIALFTCTVVRAIHLEVAEDLSSESFILNVRMKMKQCPFMIFHCSLCHLECQTTLIIL